MNSGELPYLELSTSIGILRNLGQSPEIVQ